MVVCVSVTLFPSSRISAHFMYQKYIWCESSPLRCTRRTSEIYQNFLFRSTNIAFLLFWMSEITMFTIRCACAFGSYLHVCNHTWSKYQCHFSLVCRFVSVYWTICLFEKMVSIFRMHSETLKNGKQSGFTVKCNADSETMLRLQLFCFFFYWIL